MRDLRLFAPAALLAAGCLLNFGVRSQHAAPLERPLRSIPIVLAGQAGDERTMSEAERAALGASDYLFRVFGPDSAPTFSVFVGYFENQTTGRTIHSPRNCLPGAGWQVVESGTTQVSMAGSATTVNRYLLANGPSQAIVYYWYQGRGRVAHNEYRVKWDLLRDAVVRRRSEEALVRIVVPIPAAPGYTTEAWRRRVDAAERVAQQAAREMLPLVDAVLPRWHPAQIATAPR